jgi:hypothetical protein
MRIRASCRPEPSTTLMALAQQARAYPSGGALQAVLDGADQTGGADPAQLHRAVHVAADVALAPWLAAPARPRGRR